MIGNFLKSHDLLGLDEEIMLPENMLKCAIWFIINIKRHDNVFYFLKS